MPRSLHLLTSFPPRILSITPAQPPLPVTFQTLCSDQNSHPQPLPPIFPAHSLIPQLQPQFDTIWNYHARVPHLFTALHPLHALTSSLTLFKFHSEAPHIYPHVLAPPISWLNHNPSNPDPTLPTSCVLLCNAAWLEKKYTSLLAGLKGIPTAAW